jgi:hypothetical protein
MRYSTKSHALEQITLTSGNCQKGHVCKEKSTVFAKTRCGRGGLPEHGVSLPLDYVTSFLTSWLVSKVTVPQHGRIVVNLDGRGRSQMRKRSHSEHSEGEGNDLFCVMSGTTVTWQATARNSGFVIDLGTSSGLIRPALSPAAARSQFPRWQRHRDASDTTSAPAIQWRTTE